MKIGILLYPNCSMWSAVGSMEILIRANKLQDFYYGKDHGRSIFKVQFIASENDKIQTSYPIPLPVEASLENHDKLDLVLIPGFDISPGIITRQTRIASEWIKRQYDNGVNIASICTGSLLLAQSGILDGKTATTHWLIKDYFKQLFPKVHLKTNEIIIDHDTILMSGGATSFQNLILHLIDKVMGRTVAIGVSKVYLIDFNKDNQDSYSNLIPLRSHRDKHIHKVQDYIEQNKIARISLDELAEVVILTKRTLIRRFKNATNNTPLQYIQKVKVERAKRMLEQEQKSFEEICFDLGYEDVNAFRKLFVRYAAISPREYRARYQVIGLG